MRGGKDKGIGVREYLVLVPADAVELAHDPAGTAVGVEQGRMPVLRAVEQHARDVDPVVLAVAWQRNALHGGWGELG